ncbi:MAG: MgPME-cyclase complex family protein [Cyanobacteria bacterium P01_F01_bin.3]
MQTYHYILASSQFLLEEEPLAEQIKERKRYFREKSKDIDFWLVEQPAFIETRAFAEIKSQCPQPCTAVISTNAQYIQWLKLRHEYVYVGQFEAPTDDITDPIASVSS